MSDYNAKIIEEFRANGGKVGGDWEGYSLILVHHVGAKSGIERVTPMGCFPRGDDRWAVVATNGGSPTHPAWVYNLRANPTITVEVGAETLTVVAEELEGDARAELWPELAADVPQIDEHQSKVTREVPVFMLSRAAATSA